MKKLSMICGFIGVILVLGGCSVNEDVKEIMVIHEHHIYIHNVNSGMMRRPMPGKRFGQQKGVDPRYNHKPGMMPHRKEEKSVTSVSK